MERHSAQQDPNKKWWKCSCFKFVQPHYTSWWRCIDKDDEKILPNMKRPTCLCSYIAQSSQHKIKLGHTVVKLPPAQFHLTQWHGQQDLEHETKHFQTPFPQWNVSQDRWETRRDYKQIGHGKVCRKEISDGMKCLKFGNHINHQEVP